MSLVLNAQKREKTGRKAKSIRREGLVPAIVYGTKTENINIIKKLNNRTLRIANRFLML